jgi:hypothetical protein
MLAANYDITLDRAADYSFVLTIEDALGVAVDLSDAATLFYADIRSVATKAQAVQFTPIKTAGTGGIVTFKLTKADTKLLKAGGGLYEYDIFMALGASPNTVTRRLLYGSVTVRPQFTNNV